MFQNCLKFHSPNGSWNYVYSISKYRALVVFMPNITTNHAITHTNNYKFQLIQIFITHSVAGARKFDHITPGFKENGCGFCTKNSFLKDVLAIHKSLHDYWRPQASRPTDGKMFFGMSKKS